MAYANTAPGGIQEPVGLSELKRAVRGFF